MHDILNILLFLGGREGTHAPLAGVEAALALGEQLVVDGCSRVERDAGLAEQEELCVGRLLQGHPTPSCKPA